MYVHVYTRGPYGQGFNQAYSSQGHQASQPRGTINSITGVGIGVGTVKATVVE